MNKSSYIPTVKCDSEKKTKAQAIKSKSMDGSQARYTELKEARDKGCVMRGSVYVANCKRRPVYRQQTGQRPGTAGGEGLDPYGE